MAKYVSVKGWLECDQCQIKEIHKIILDYEFKADFEQSIGHENVKLYNKGWCNQNEAINWTSYIFYGADVKEYCLDFIKCEIKEILNKCLEIDGMFFFSI